MARLVKFTSGAIWPNSRADRGVAVALMALVAVSVAYLIFADTPWDDTLQKRVESGMPLKPEHYGIIGHWWVSVVTVFVGLTVLLLGRKWWWTPVSEVEVRPDCLEDSQKRYSGRVVRIAILLVIGAVVYGGMARAPRLSHGFWNDEEYAFHRYSWGEVQIDETGARQFKHVDWERALSFNHTGNNHLVHTILARLSIGAWNKATGAEEGQFSEASARVFPFAAGLIAIGIAGWLGTAVGGPWIGAACSWMLALSPWHVRYSVEARGYSLMFMALLLMVASAIRALERGGWRWWLLSSLSGAVALAAFPGCVYVLLIFWPVTLILAWMGRSDKPKGVARLLIGNLLGAVGVLWLWLPSVPQVLAYLRRSDTWRAEINTEWLRDLQSHLVSGIPPFTMDLGYQLGLGVGNLSAVAQCILTWVIPALSVVGLFSVVLSKSKTPGLLVVAAFVGGPCVLLLREFGNEVPMFGWYLFYSLPILVVLVPAAATHIVRVLPKFGIAFLFAVVTSYGWATHAPRARLAEVPRQTTRDVSEFIRGADRADMSPITASFGTSSRQAFSYDPALKLVSSISELRAIEVEAQESGRPLFVYFCGGRRALERDPELVEDIVNSVHYELVAEFLAFEELFGYQVFAFRR